MLSPSTGARSRHCGRGPSGARPPHLPCANARARSRRAAGGRVHAARRRRPARGARAAALVELRAGRDPVLRRGCVHIGGRVGGRVGGGHEAEPEPEPEAARLRRGPRAGGREQRAARRRTQQFGVARGGHVHAARAALSRARPRMRLASAPSLISALSIRQYCDVLLEHSSACTAKQNNIECTT